MGPGLPPRRVHGSVPDRSRVPRRRRQSERAEAANLTAASEHEGPPPPSLPPARLVGQASAGSNLRPEPPPRRCHAILLSEFAQGQSSSLPAQATDLS